MNSKAAIFNVMVFGMTSLILASCDGSRSESDDPGPNSVALVANPTWGKAIVKGQPGHLEDFDENFKQILGLSGLEAHQIGCVEGCDKFGDSDLNRLLYVFPREYPEILSHFGKAWDSTQKASGDGDFALEFDGNVSESDCTGSSNPAPCQSMPYCAIDRCGRMVNGKPDCAAC